MLALRQWSGGAFVENIVIGEVNRDWHAVRRARYYAERGEDYGFGASPSKALENLEVREARLAVRFDADLAQEIAFLALGAAETLKERGSPSLDKFEGYMGFIERVVCHAPLLATTWQRVQDEFDGVWLYDVTERFGREWAESLLEAFDETPEDRLDMILEDEMRDYESAT